MTTHISILLLVGLITITGFYSGRYIKFIRLPSIIGFMLIGVVAGPSVINIISEDVQSRLAFITQICLGFVALSIGLELNFSSIKRQGRGIVVIILAESLMAFAFVMTAVYLVTGDIALALIFGGIAPASAPAGTVAVIHEYRAQGSLTKALYSVVGFDDGLGIIIFGFAAAIARSILINNGSICLDSDILKVLWQPFSEMFLSIITGVVLAFLLKLLIGRMRNQRDIFILVFGFILTATGLAESFHFSLILTNMVIGMVLVNVMPHAQVEMAGEEMKNLLPLIFILFFALAGSGLHIQAFPTLGLIGLVYIAARSLGLIGGAWIGATIGRAEEKIRKYLGLGILSQAGVAIGLSLIAFHDFKGLGDVVSRNGADVTTGDILGKTVLTTVTATCIVFEIFGPVLTKIALKKAGEIGKAK